MNLLFYLSLTLLTTTTTLASTLGIKTTHPIDPSSCTRKTTPGDAVHVHYRGTLSDSGEEFDASYKRGEPLVFPVGKGIVIKG